VAKHFQRRAVLLARCSRASGLAGALSLKEVDGQEWSCFPSKFPGDCEVDVISGVQSSPTPGWSGTRQAPDWVHLHAVVHNYCRSLNYAGQIHVCHRRRDGGFVTRRGKPLRYNNRLSNRLCGWWLPPFPCSADRSNLHFAIVILQFSLCLAKYRGARMEREFKREVRQAAGGCVAPLRKTPGPFRQFLLMGVGKLAVRSPTRRGNCRKVRETLTRSQFLFLFRWSPVPL
jgi:hypothetical protein